MNPKIIRQAIENAEEELGAVKAKIREMEPLVVRRNTLEAFILQAKTLLGEDRGERGDAEEESPGALRVRGAISSRKNAPVWSGCREVLAEHKRPMTATEITGILLNRGWKLHKKWGSEVVRAGMARKLDVFEKVGKNTFALKEWPDHFKRVA